MLRLACIARSWSQGGDRTLALWSLICVTRIFIVCLCSPWISAMIWHAVVVALGVAARGADIGDAESARVARIDLLKDENAKMMRTLEKVRGAISYWAALGFAPGVGVASSAEDEGPAAPAEPAGAPGPGRRLESKVPDGVKVWQGGVLHNFKNAETCPTAWSKCPPLGDAPARLLCLLSARLAAPGSSALPGRGRATGRPATASGASSQPRKFSPRSSPPNFPALDMQARARTPSTMIPTR